MKKESCRIGQVQQSISITAIDQSVEVLRRQMYQRIANGHVIEIAEEQARRDQQVGKVEILKRKINLSKFS